MKKIILFSSMTTVFLLGGCSLLGEVNQSMDYVNEANEYINELNTFSEEVPRAIEKAVENPALVNELENYLTALQEDIAEFNNLDAPSIATDIHQRLVNKNEELQETINNVMVNGEVAVEKLQNTELITTIEQIIQLRNQIEQLGVN